MNQQFINAYIDAALWSSTDDNGFPLDETSATLSADALRVMCRDADKFLKANCTLICAMPIDYTLESAGHDFWLTRCGHGVGFWDRGADTIGHLLTDAAEECGSVDLIVDDDDKIYLYPS